MKHARLLIIPIVLAAIFLILRQSQAQGVRSYTCKTTSVTSATVPVSIIAPASMTAWNIHARAAGATSILVFPYVTTLPTAVPSPAAVMEVAPAAYFFDQITCTTPSCRDGVGNGWAAVLLTGSTAVTTDACWR